MMRPMLEAGLVLEQIVEPRPTEEFRRASPEGYAFLMREPAFLCFRVRGP